MWIDIHVQTENTAGGLGLEEVAAAARESGLDGLAVTDVGTLPDQEELERISQTTGVRLFTGIKLPTEAGTWLAYPARQGEGESLSFAPEEGGLYPLSAVETLARDGWALVLSQPFGSGGPGEAVYSMKGLHGLEVVNSSSSLSAKDLSLEAALALKLAVIGGSGALDDLSVLGKVGTAFMPSVSTQRDFHRAIISGDVMLAERGKRDIQEVDEKQPRRRKPRRRKPRKSE